MAGVVSITRVEEPGQLLRYAAIAQLEAVKEATGYTQTTIAANLPKYKEKGNFNRALQKPSDELLAYLDGVNLALMPELDRTGGLSALAVRLRRTDTPEVLIPRLPAAWGREATRRTLVDEVDVVNAGAKLLDKMRAVRDNAKQVRDRNKELLEHVITRLILIGAAPPTPHNVEALMLLGGIAGAPSAFGVVDRHLENALASHPLGFRVWRAVTTVVKINETDLAAVRSIKPWVRHQLDAAETRRRDSLFPARCLDLELAIAIPKSWSPPGPNDWAAEALRRRVDNPDASVRERGTAATGLWERACEQGDEHHRRETEVFLRTVIDRFRDEAKTSDHTNGLSWVADTLEHNLDDQVAVCNTWPRTEEPALRIVGDAADLVTAPEAAIPANIQKATKTLLHHALLQNAGVHRRHAIDTLAAGSWTSPLIPALEHVITHPESKTWLRCRALFALSFLQDRGYDVERVMREACERTKKRVDDALTDSPDLPPAIAADMHAALFAVGDCFGTIGSEDVSRRLREALDPLLADLLTASSTNGSLTRVGRAAAYLVAVTAQNGDTTSQPMLQRVVEHHEDEATTRLCRWALSRFHPDGTVMPIHMAFGPY